MKQEEQDFNKIHKAYFYLGQTLLTITFLSMVGGIWYIVLNK